MDSNGSGKSISHAPLISILFDFNTSIHFHFHSINRGRNRESMAEARALEEIVSHWRRGKK
jgi:hypothetical protein